MLQTEKSGDWPHWSSAFFKVRPNVISGLPVGRKCATQPVSSCLCTQLTGMDDR